MKNKIKYFISAGFLILSLLLFVASAILTEYFNNLWWTIVVSLILFIGLIIITFYFYIKASEFVCPKCNTQFKPKANSTIWAIHTITKRYLRCPHCQEKSWCKEVFPEK